MTADVTYLLVEQVELVELSRQQQLGGPQEVEDVAEHLAVTVDEVVLLQTVEDDRHAPVEHLAEAGLGVPADKQTDAAVKQGGTRVPADR